MTGTGTQTDPYIVDNWDDFITATGESGAYVAFPEGGGVIDVDKVYPLGVPKITMNCTQIDGNGWEIRGLYMDVSGSAITFLPSSTITINDLSFLNVNIKSSEHMFFTSASTTSTRTTTLNNMKISGRFASTGESINSTVFGGGSSNYKVTRILNRCSINLELVGYYTHFCYSSSGDYKTTINFCNIYLNVMNHKANWGVFRDLYSKGSIIRGKYNLNSAYVEQMFDYINAGSDLVFLGEITTDNSTQKISYCDNGDAATTKVLFNKDNISDKMTTYNKGSSAYLCTTEQLKDADYLKSIGFPIGE
jgi:hypothetical protein